MLFKTRDMDSKLFKARLVNNYLGLPEISGQELLKVFAGHAKARGALIVNEKIVNIYPEDGAYTLVAAEKSWQAAAVVLAMGAPAERLLPGESEFLGRGVSYCATCDGLFFRGKKVAVIASSNADEDEVAFLAGLCGEILYFPLYKGEYPRYPNLKVLREIPKKINGIETVGAVKNGRRRSRGGRRVYFPRERAAGQYFTRVGAVG
jgi:thioredoxin reductase (NADPH)